MWELAVPVSIGVVAILFIGLLFARLYRRSTRDEAYVRTGLGGQKVVLDGGSLVLPVFHSTAPVNLKTLRLEVIRGGPDTFHGLSSRFLLSERRLPVCSPSLLAQLPLTEIADLSRQ